MLLLLLSSTTRPRKMNYYSPRIPRSEESRKQFAPECFRGFPKIRIQKHRVKPDRSASFGLDRIRPITNRSIIQSRVSPRARRNTRFYSNEIVPCPRNYNKYASDFFFFLFFEIRGSGTKPQCRRSPTSFGINARAGNRRRIE